MRILLTGTSGQVGGTLLPLLRGAHTVIAPASAEFDLSKPGSLAERLEAMRPDLIVNPAAYTAVDRAEDEPALAFLVNGDAPDVMARWAAAHDVPIVQFSTDYVFDGGSSRAWREDDPTAPLSVYGRSKLAGELAVRAAGGPHLVVRTAWVYAAQGTNFMRTLIRLARQQEQLRVVSDQFGSPTSARTIASTVVAILKQAEAGQATAFARSQGLVHVGNSGRTSWHGFACAILEGLRARGAALKANEVLPIASSEYPSKVTRPANSQLDLTRLGEAYGIQPPSWKSALAEELDALGPLQVVR